MPTLRQRQSDRRADRALCRNLQPRILPESVLAGRQREGGAPNLFEPVEEGWRDPGAHRNGEPTELPEAPAMSYRLHEAIKAALVRALREANGNVVNIRLIAATNRNLHAMEIAMRR